MQLIRPHSTLLKRSMHEAVFLASSMVDRSAESARVALEEAERQAAVVAQRMQMGDALIALAKNRARLRTGFPLCVEAAISSALNELKKTETVRPSVIGSLESLSLMAEAEVSRFVESSRLQQTVLPVVEQALSQLDTLMSSALGLPVVRADLNPMRPEVLCGALMEAVGAVPEPPEIHALLIRYLARPFADELNRLYAALTKLLEEKGVQEARYRLKLTEAGGASAPQRGGRTSATGAGAAAAGQGGGHAGGPRGSLPSDADMARRRRTLPLFDMEQLAQTELAVPRALVREFLYRPQWMAEHDEPLPVGYYEAVRAQIQAQAAEPTAPLPDDHELFAEQQRHRALPVVDRPPRPLNAHAVLPRAHWGEAASPHARTQTLMQLKSKARKVSQVLGLDAVRALVGQVAGDGRVLAPVREAFVALEPALLRMAMHDPRFMGDEDHPARRLVESVAQRSFKYNDEFSEEFEQFMAPVRESVRALGSKPHAGANDFAEHLQALQTRWTEEDHDEAAGREHGLRSMHFAHDRQALADKVAWEFSLRSDLAGVPGIVMDFLFRDWALVIAHAQLTDTRGQLDPGGYLAVVTDLLWSVKRDAALRQPTRLFEVVPHVVQTLRRGLDMLGKDPAESQAFFDALMRYHHPVLRLRRVRSARDAEASGVAPAGVSGLEAALPEAFEPMPLEKCQPQAAEQPWLGRHEREAAGFQDTADSALVPGEETADADTGREAADQPTDTALADAHAPTLFQHAGDLAADAGDQVAESRAQLARLREGDWVDLRVEEQWRRAQLVWSSGNGALFMFVSQGGQPHSMTRRSCERLLHKRHLRIVDAGEVVEQALRNMSEPDPEPLATGRHPGGDR
ncbi:DUF1631 family protein [Comamonadaceae bacterium OH2545_COT-014]|nr:DUF1631 family protein [Comamonadaceae bacterium OH2545_COT-014]